MADSTADTMSKETLGLPIFISHISNNPITSTSTNIPSSSSARVSSGLPLLSTKRISRALDHILISSPSTSESTASTSTPSSSRASLFSPLSPKRISQALDFAVASVEASLESIAKTAVNFLEVEQPPESMQTRHRDLESGGYYADRRFENEEGRVEGWLD